MNIFLSYAHTGENEVDVRRRMQTVHDALASGGNNVYCNMFDEDTKHFSTPREFIFDALEKLRAYDTVLVINTSERRSEGMLIEIGAALALGKRLIVAQHSSSVGKTYVPELAEHTFVWHHEEDLLDLIVKQVNGAQPRALAEELSES